MTERFKQLEFNQFNEGRNFREVQAEIEQKSKTKQLNTTPSGAREQAMQVGDYIDMHINDFLSWASIGPESGSVRGLSDRKMVRVVLMEIKRDDSELVVVEADGFKKTVHASLFYNYGYSFIS